MTHLLCEGKIFLTGWILKNDCLSDNTYYYHGDHLGSMSWITDGNGELVEHRTYMPYGEEWYHYKASEKYTERFTFTGKERDEESGYDYFGARYYDSRLLTSWLSVDPKAHWYPYLNPYLYSGGNPIKNVDKNGGWFETAWDLANVAMDVNSLKDNIKSGNTGGAIADGVGLILDVAATVLPVVPAGAGAAIKATRTAKNADKAVDEAKALKNFSGEHKIPANGGKAKPHGGQKHNEAIDDFIRNNTN